MAKKRKSVWIPLGIALGYLALLLIATHLPLPESAQNRLSYVDKPLHLLAYLILAFALSSIPVGRLAWRLVVVAIICVAIAMLDEFTQAIIPSRNSDRIDFVADCLGISLGVGAAIARSWYERRGTAPPQKK